MGELVTVDGGGTVGGIKDGVSAADGSCGVVPGNGSGGECVFVVCVVVKVACAEEKKVGLYGEVRV